MRYSLRMPELDLEPSAPDVICRCSRCSGEIYDGNEYFTFDGYPFCTECFMDHAPEILLEQYGAERHIAERSDEYDNF